MAQRQGRFLTGSTMGHVVRMTLTGTMGITFVFLVDAANLFWISQLGDARLMAAIGYAFAIQFFTVSIGVGMMIAATALVSRKIGMGERQQARHHATAAMLLTGAVQACVAALVVTFRHDLVALVGAGGDTADLAARYLAMTIPSLVIMAIGLVGGASLRAEGDGKRAMFVTLTSGAVAMVIDPFLILGLRMGLDGAALGLNISRVVMAGMALQFAVRVHDLLAWPSLWALRVTACPFAVVALPAIATQISAPFGNYLLTSVIAGFGDSAVAAWAVINRLTVVAFGGIFSLSGAIGGIFGQNFGARHYDRLRTTFRDALIFCAVYACVTWAALVLVSDLVARGFALDAEAAEVLHAFTHIGAGAFIFTGALFVSNAAFNNLGRPGLSTVANWLREGVMTLPLAIWLAGIWGASGAIYAQALAGVVVGSAACLWGWLFVRGIGRDPAASVDLGARRGYRDVNRYRRR